MFDEQKREAIRIEAQSLLRRFSEKISKVEIGNIEKKDLGNGMRRNGNKVDDGNFREIMFRNAKNKNGDFIVAEKKKW